MAYKQYMYRWITILLTIKCYLYNNGEKNIFLVFNVDPPPLTTTPANNQTVKQCCILASSIYLN